MYTRSKFNILLISILISESLESPITNSPKDFQDSKNQNGGGGGGAEISYFWHQKAPDLISFWPDSPPLPSTSSTIKKSLGNDHLILIHRISDDEGENINNNNGGIISTGFNNQRIRDETQRLFNKAQIEADNNNNIFVFCLMFLFGLIICGLIWCLCTVNRNSNDNNGDISSRSGRRANLEVIMPYTTDLPPSYDDIVSDFEKLGSQCILPSYRDIMTRKSSNTDIRRPSPPPRYTSPKGSFSAQGNRNEENIS